MKTLSAWRACILGAALLLPSAAYAHPGSGIVVDRAGNVYFVDTGSGLWKIDLSGTLVRVTAPRFHWLTLDADDRFATVPIPSVSGGAVERIGRSPMLMLASDSPLAIARDGNLYYPMRGTPAGLDLMRLSPSGRSEFFARVPLHWLNGLAAAPDGSLYYSSEDGVWRISARGQVTEVKTHIALAGCAAVPSTEGTGPNLRGLAVDSADNAYVAASGCGRVIKIALSGAITTVYQTEAPWSPTAVALHGRDLYVLEYLHTATEDRAAWTPRVRKVTPDGRSTIIATVTR